MRAGSRCTSGQPPAAEHAMQRNVGRGKERAVAHRREQRRWRSVRCRRDARDDRNAIGRTGVGFRQWRRQGSLQGLRVLDAGTMIAGPLAATHLADFGAEVIKIEQPRIGDAMRQWAPMKDGRSLWWKVIARNKRLITLTLSHAERPGAVPPHGRRRGHRDRELSARNLRALGSRLCRAGEGESARGAGARVRVRPDRAIRASRRIRHGRGGVQRHPQLHRLPRSAADAAGLSDGGFGRRRRSPPWRPCSRSIAATRAAPASARRSTSASTNRCSASPRRRRSASTNSASSSSARATGWPRIRRATPTKRQTDAGSAFPPARSARSSVCARRWAWRR